MEIEGPTGLVSFIFSEAGIGKSALTDTAPAPKLIIDTEGKSKYFRGPKVYWDPLLEKPPVADRVIVLLKKYDTFEHIFNHLQTENPYMSCTIDSFWEAQNLLIRELFGVKQLDQQNWGEIKRKLAALVANYMLLDFQTLTMTSGAVHKDGLIRPMLDGAIVSVLSHYVDLIGYLYPEVNKETGQLDRKLLVQPIPPYATKDNTGAFPGPVLDNPNLSDMLSVYLKHIGGIE